MDKIILLDSNSLINRAYYALPNLTNKNGEHTGAIFGYTNMLLKLISLYKPTHIIATFDRKAPTFRKQLYADYKATRKGMPPELASQLQPLKELLTAMKIPIVELDGYEADDLIGTLAKKYNIPTYIVTGDRDSLQLIDDNTTVLLTKKGVSEIVEYDTKRLAQDNLTPSQIIDLKSLMGDASDNIPGVAGVGEKTAMSLIENYGTLDGVYANIDQIKGKLKEKLEADKQKAYLSYELATININCPIEFDLDDAKYVYPFEIKVKEKFNQLEFFRLADKVEFVGEESKQNSKEYKILTLSNLEQLEIVKNEIIQHKIFSIIIRQNIYISTNDQLSYNIIINDNLLGEGIRYDEFLDAMKAFFESSDIKIIVFDSKALMHQLSLYGISLNNFEDVMIKAYLIDANKNYKNAEDLIRGFGFGSECYSAGLLELDQEMTKKLAYDNLDKLYYQMDLPLVKVLFDMEQIGFAVDKNALNKLSEKFGAEIDSLISQIMQYAQKPFNINSPKQLAQFLFEELGLKSGKKNKSGLSTNIEVLNSLVGIHPVIDMILRYRELSKLKSTYLDGIVPLIDTNGRIHTIFKQTVAATGRLSSTEPNLQNIPVRKKEGKHIREMFVAEQGKKLVCADYSQIELRLMAVFSGDPTMIQAFKNNEDIHATTAAQVFGVSLDQVTADMRRQAKAVNFGIIYGISDYGLAVDLGIAVWQAKEFIQKYFETYPKVKEYMNNAVLSAKANGYASTYLGRRRDIPELKSSNINIRNFGERVAMNMPLQGSASDIIKMAMLATDQKLKQEKLEAKLIMQVHDELIVECPLNEVDKVKALLKDAMESVADFSVKLDVECGDGDNWLQAK